jgi:hypothetical protein
MNKYKAFSAQLHHSFFVIEALRQYIEMMTKADTFSFLIRPSIRKSFVVKLFLGQW